MIQGRLGALRDLEAVRAYLQERDSAPPTAIPEPDGITSTPIGVGVRYDVIAWGYDQPRPPSLPADGFVVFWSVGDTADPRQNGTLVAAAERSFGLLVGTAIPISYAVAAYRQTHIGQQLTTRVQVPSWRAVIGTGPPAAVTQAMRFNVPLVGTMDGVNTVFTVPLPIGVDAAGMPMAQLIWRRAIQEYTTDDPPAAGQWHLRPDQAIQLGDAPQADDWLVFAFLVLG